MLLFPVYYTIRSPFDNIRNAFPQLLRMWAAICLLNENMIE